MIKWSDGETMVTVSWSWRFVASVQLVMWGDGG